MEQHANLILGEQVQAGLVKLHKRVRYELLDELDGTRVGRGCECGAKHKTVVVDESINRVKIVTSITLFRAK